jgi:hypothetical protein
MKIRTLKVIAFLLLSTLWAGKSFGQEAPGDSINHQTSFGQVVSNFYIAIGQESRLYNGPEYHPYDRNIKGSALFPLDAETWATGKVNYDGIDYEGVPLMYDIYKDVLVALLYNHFSMYILQSDRVRDFTFSGHHFIRINADSLVNDRADISTGFYEQLYKGKTAVLVKWVKTIQHSTSITTILETYFIENHDFYLLKGNTYYKVNSKGAFLDALKDKKPALQKYLKDNHINFRQDPATAMAILAAYYDRI